MLRARMYPRSACLIATVLSVAAACRPAQPDADQSPASAPSSAPKPPSDPITLADFRSGSATFYDYARTWWAPRACIVVNQLVPSDGTEAKLHRRFPGHTVTGWKIEVDHPGRVRLVLDEVRKSYRVMDTTFRASPDEPVLLLFTLGVAESQLRTSLSAVSLLVRSDGSCSETPAACGESFMPQQLAPYLVGWDTPTAWSGAFDPEDTLPLAIWSWNGVVSDWLAEQELFGTGLMCPIPPETEEAASKPVRDWSRPVLVLTCCYLAD